jgi:small-conductance mechanosensitive channel
LVNKLFATLILGALLVGVATTPRLSEATAPEGTLESPEWEAEMAMTAPVEIDGKALLWVRGTTAFPADQRAARIRERIVALARDASFETSRLRLVESEISTKVMADGQLVLNVFDSDARVQDVRRQVLASAALDRVAQAITDYRQARSRDALLNGVLISLGGTLALALAIALIIWLRYRLDALIARRLQGRISSLSIQSFEIVRAANLARALRGLNHGLALLIIVAAGFAYLDFVLAQFPWTLGIANHLLDLLTGPLAAMGEAVVIALPKLIFLVILYYLVRFILRMARLFFEAVARGSVTLASFEPEWALPTYKIVRVAIFALGLVVAYPYIPGSSSDAFKGITIFLGLVFSLGSSSAVANIIAGYLMTYRRAFKVGDRVRIDDIVGDILEVRLQATHLRTLKNEEVTLPNAKLLEGRVVNYSSLAAKQGLILHTTVGIGYETPWRQVEAMLIAAAELTPGLLREPPPFVMQKSLGDYAVNYELNVYCRDAKAMEQGYSALHRHILDVFNEYGVQIMTPSYEADPEVPKLVPREQWYAAPAVREAEAGQS